MCMKFGANELDTVRQLMAFSLLALASQVFGTDIDGLSLDTRVQAAAGGDPVLVQAFRDGVADYFDGLRPALGSDTTLGEVLDLVAA